MDARGRATGSLKAVKGFNEQSTSQRSLRQRPNNSTGSLIKDQVLTLKGRCGGEMLGKLWRGHLLVSIFRLLSSLVPAHPWVLSAESVNK